MKTRANGLIRMVVVLATLLFAHEPATAQRVLGTATRPSVETSRAELERLLVRLEQTAASSQYSDEVRIRARQEAALLRARLAQGDFQPGDRVSLYVQEEPTLSDTFAVTRNYELELPILGAVPVRGILYSELESQVRQQLARKIKDPVVRAQPLVRVSVLGAIGRPGFYLVPPESLVTEVLMGAGGPARDAKITKIYIVRNDERIWEGDAMQNAIIEGRTLEQLGVRAGDRIVVPEAGSGFSLARVASTIGIVASLTFALSRIGVF